jgi:hypothetical protein
MAVDCAGLSVSKHSAGALNGTASTLSPPGSVGNFTLGSSTLAELGVCGGLVSTQVTAWSRDKYACPSLNATASVGRVMGLTVRVYH